MSTEEGLGHLQEIFEEFAERLSEQTDGFGRYVAVNGTAVHVYSNGSRKRISDPDVAWGPTANRSRAAVRRAAWVRSFA